MRRTIFALLIGLIMLAGAASAFAQGGEDSDPWLSDDAPYPCPYTEGAFYQPGLFPRYDADAGALVLADVTTGQTVRVLDTFTENVRIINWSPDCRYLSGAVGELQLLREYSYTWGNWSVAPWLNRVIVFWDTVSGERTYTFEHNYGEGLANSPVIWNSIGDRALVLSGYNHDSRHRIRYDFIWQQSTNSSVLVGPTRLESWNYHSGVQFTQYYWDEIRDWLWGSLSGGVVAFDINTGVEAAFFANQDSWPETRFVFSPDGTKVVVYSIATPGSLGAGSITIYDIATMTATPVNAEGFAAPYIPFADYHPVALSADNRYLVVGYDALRVWDIQNLPEAVEDRLPIYRHGGPEALIQSVRFADWGVIETVSAEGVQRWDLHTGEYIP